MRLCKSKACKIDYNIHSAEFRHSSDQVQVLVTCLKYSFSCNLIGYLTGTKRRVRTCGLNQLCGVTLKLQVIVGKSLLPRTDV